ncbi:pyridoxamine 5'-phosphate oxidase family protein [Streptacidiphilus sp. ASG 303]|uniref:pyridoxamine 5'-phosphate oxidase family protein n=1 Tax=Streptacidiphilus sp. ASG 303 TaxID=2896847 RepID=UPI001E4C15A6|nr:pyridoxamine 5'-phosphate oxidase family protein [Streptacidiphilus sp. ASG 303]MCD0482251.1 pyridoxamine 5'-phosphate oxidase family protein [Streptacidiphilus sp. ASG 303]
MTVAPFHLGERAVQARAGVLDSADHVGRSIRSTVPPVAAAFLAERRMLVLGAADGAGRLWATLLTGPAGFVTAPDEHTLAVAAPPGPGDPLAEALAGPAKVGTLALDPAGRRRMRVNGRSRPHGGGLLVDADQVYANCPRYIQRRRTLEPAGPAPGPVPARGPAVRGTSLTADQQSRLGSADTFFVATADDRGDADASHRGGNPGFLEVLGPDRLRWPEYPGNTMFMTLGNLEVNPAAGLLLPDWAGGAALLLSGTARTVRGGPSGGTAVEFAVTDVVDLPGASPLRWSDPEYSPANPPVEH